MQNHEYEHRPVLLDEALQALNIRSDGIYVDATFGRGGHAQAILGQLNESGRLFAIDKDPQAVAAARQQLGADARFAILHGSFAQLQRWLSEQGVAGRVDGVLMDLGVSSPQLDDAQRGFSFYQEGPLDMRMDPTSGVAAADWLAVVPEAELSALLRDLGEERFHRRIARAIVQARDEAPIATTRQLAELVASVVPTREKNKHPATRTFQAIRIHINRELEDLQQALMQAVSVLGAGGRLVVISFHSLEDRIVKRFMRDQAQGEHRHLPPDLPVRHAELRATFRLVGKAVRAGEREVKSNPRARSAVIRVGERLA